MIRTFIALEIPDIVLDEIIMVRDKLLYNAGRLRWESKDKMHVTLKFLGDTDQNKVEDIFNSIKRVALNFSKFNLELDRFGFFKSNGIPKILWAGLKENLELEKFVREIDILCTEFGFEKERRKFKPHVTMLRIKNENIIKDVIAFENYKLPDLKFKGEKIILFQSILQSGGSIYKPIKSLLI
ncbi:MAG: RNA 2',3'-cyclic phosphodiesterase [Ignavibacteria bacterium]|nr:RNA 2',3'-cyclic phosphodiesterase [Ignavibacteria bacterium]